MLLLVGAPSAGEHQERGVEQLLEAEEWPTEAHLSAFVPGDADLAQVARSVESGRRGHRSPAPSKNAVMMASMDATSVAVIAVTSTGSLRSRSTSRISSGRWSDVRKRCSKRARLSSV